MPARPPPANRSFLERFGDTDGQSSMSGLDRSPAEECGKKIKHEGEALPFRSRQPSLRAAALLKRPAAGANMTRRPGLAHLHGE